MTSCGRPGTASAAVSGRPQEHQKYVAFRSECESVAHWGHLNRAIHITPCEVIGLPGRGLEMRSFRCS